MQRRAHLAVAALATLTLSAAPAPAAAAPAQIVDTLECSQDEEEGLDVCFRQRGVIKTTRTSPDDFRLHAVLRATSTSTRDGVLVRTVTSKSTRQERIRDGHVVMLSTTLRATTTTSEAVCTTTIRNRVVKGELRADVDDITCRVVASGG